MKAVNDGPKKGKEMKVNQNQNKLIEKSLMIQKQNTDIEMQKVLIIESNEDNIDRVVDILSGTNSQGNDDTRMAD